MRIDFIISGLYPGGAERVLVLLANHFSENGYDVNLITLNEAESYQVSEQVTRIKLHEGSIKIAKLRGLVNLFKYYRHKTNRPEVIISFTTFLNFLTITVANFYKIPIIVSEHTNHLNINKPKWLYDYIRTLLYPKANFVTVLTAFDQAFFNKKGCNTVIMPNPITFKPISKLPSNRKKNILAVGYLERYHIKGFDNLIQFIEPVLKEHKEWNLIIAGGGENGKAYLTHLVDEKGLTERILFTGQINNVKEVMVESSIYILSSRLEGLPMVLLEAMSQGMACIAYDCVTGPSEMINNNVNGLLIEDQNMEEMKKGLVRLIESETLRIELGENALKSLDKYDIYNVAQIWMNLFNKCTSIKTSSKLKS
ncbi:MAG: glycosyltransferase family 4 protein [Bacteroidota bacterium]|nr:glycosyltransferase family 4 protein [Bacteroidota bacterium]